MHVDPNAMCSCAIRRRPRRRGRRSGPRGGKSVPEFRARIRRAGRRRHLRERLRRLPSADAKGAVGAGAYPALAGSSNLGSADYVLRVVIRGQRDMPPLGGMMSDEQVADVVNYVRSHFGNNYRDTVSVAAVHAARPPSPSP